MVLRRAGEPVQRHAKYGNASKRRAHADGNLRARRKMVRCRTWECIVARSARRLDRVVGAILEARVERVGGVIGDVHRGEREHRRVVVQRDLSSL